VVTRLSDPFIAFHPFCGGYDPVARNREERPPAPIGTGRGVIDLKGRRDMARGLPSRSPMTSSDDRAVAPDPGA
jgi:hypothetical protein